ncbi:metallophosphoesterase family protein [Anaerotalea alkaliphila]|nr:metallophosphoesterase [Anaerotalea alkaliphila]
MTILVISDTHGHLKHVEALLARNKGIDRIVHLGDHAADGEYLEALTDLPVDRVSGNCDYPDGENPLEKVLEVHGKRILLTHGHLRQVKYGLETLRAHVREEGLDGAFFGHTHCRFLGYEGDAVLLNPGSMSLPRDGGGPSFALVQVGEDGILHVSLGEMQGKKPVKLF